MTIYIGIKSYCYRFGPKHLKEGHQRAKNLQIKFHDYLVNLDPEYAWVKGGTPELRNSQLVVKHQQGWPDLKKAEAMIQQELLVNEEFHIIIFARNDDTTRKTTWTQMWHRITPSEIKKKAGQLSQDDYDRINGYWHSRMRNMAGRMRLRLFGTRHVNDHWQGEDGWSYNTGIVTDDIGIPLSRSKKQDVWQLYFEKHRLWPVDPDQIGVAYKLRKKAKQEEE